jgi:hypothetical protein
MLSIRSKMKTFVHLKEPGNMKIYLAAIACLGLCACADLQLSETDTAAASRHYAPSSSGIMGHSISGMGLSKTSSLLSTDAHTYMDEPEINVQRLISPHRRN